MIRILNSYYILPSLLKCMGFMGLYASPMIFMNKQYWTEEMPVYKLMQYLVEKGKYNNLLLSISDSVNDIVSEIERFRDSK